MTNSIRRRPALVVSAALCALPACSTQEIGSGALVTHQKQTGPNQAALLILTCN